MKSSVNPNRHVDLWFEKTRNPQKKLIAAVREVVLTADERVGERLKWNAPTFTYRGELATFFPKARSYACLLFHGGADVPGDFPSFHHEQSGAMTLRIRSASELEAKRQELQALVRAACDLKDSDAA